MEEDPRFVALREAESRLEKDPEIVSLAKIKTEKEQEYNDAISHFGEKNPLSIEKRKSLHQAKLNLDNHPLSKKYTEAFVAVRDLLCRLDDILFDDLRIRENCSK